jgi:predicted amidophosphoribosyltransferase
MSVMAAVLLPGRCPGCDRRSDGLCAACERRARPPDHAPPPPGLDGWASAFAYEGPVRELVARYKYANRRAAHGWLVEHLVAAARRDLATPGGRVDVVTWVPTTAGRRQQRGFDHGALLAVGVGRRLGVPVRPLLDRRDDRPQTGRSRTSRLVGPRLVARPVGGARVLLVDDVATTGASLVAAAEALRAGGARWVGALTVARTPRRGAA